MDPITERTFSDGEDNTSRIVSEEEDSVGPNLTPEEEACQAIAEQFLLTQAAYQQLLEELAVDKVIDAARVFLAQAIELPEGGIGDHSEWLEFCQNIIRAILAILRFLHHWAPPLPDHLVVRLINMIDLLKDMAGTIAYSADRNGHFDPLDLEDLDTFTRHHTWMVNRIR